MIFGGIDLKKMEVKVEHDSLQFTYEEKDEKRCRIAMGSIEMLKRGGSEEWHYELIGKTVKITYKPIQSAVTLGSIKKAFEAIMLL